MDGEINCKVIHDSLTTPIMTSDPSQMARDLPTKEISKQNTFVSPAQAIADAWNKESLENQESGPEIRRCKENKSQAIRSFSNDPYVIYFLVHGGFDIQGGLLRCAF
ncbi:hypothetical protein AB1N83_002114 [Pleurotus pulmonarius]